MSEYRYYIQKIYRPAPDLLVVEAGDRRGQPVFGYRPGQYALISYKNAHGVREDKHAFSLASSPTQRGSICFGVRIGGAFTQGLAGLKEGDELTVSGPHGTFFYDENKYADLVFIAGGIGVTPFLSALNYATDKGLKNKLSLIYSNKTRSGTPFYEEIKDLARRNPNISLLCAFTEEPGDIKEERVLYQRINSEIIKDFIGSVQGKTFFICGPNPFMEAIVSSLSSLGVNQDQIKMEAFSMIPDGSWRARWRNISYALGFSVILFIIFFNLIDRPVVTKSKTGPDISYINKINQAAYNRMMSIYAAKNQSLADLQTRILEATKNANIAGSSVPAPATSAPAYTAPATISAPTPNYTAPVPVITPVPAPTTRVS